MVGSTNHNLKNSNEIKSEQLGMSHSKAQHILRKEILFHLIKKCGLDTCIRCNTPITNSKDLSIDHIDPWLYSDDPAKTFFNMDNIKFSHTFCNYRAKRFTRNPNLISKSGYRGVYYQKDGKRSKPWRVTIYHNNRQKTIGYYTTPEKAAIAYDTASIELYGNRAVTNKSLGLL